MTQPDVGHEYRMQLLHDCMASGDAFATIFAAHEERIQDPVLTLLEPDCQFGGSILHLMMRRGDFPQADVDDALQTCRDEGRPPYVSCALAGSMVRAVMSGTDNLHLVQLLDDLAQDGQLPAMIAAANSITVCGYSHDDIRKPRPADVERARRRMRAERRRR